MLAGAHELDAGVAELATVQGSVESVAGEAVQLIDVHAVEGILARRIGDHPEELGPVVRPAAQRGVGVHGHHGVAAPSRLVAAYAHLVLDRLIALLIA